MVMQNLLTLEEDPKPQISTFYCDSKSPNTLHFTQKQKMEEDEYIMLTSRIKNEGSL